MNRTSYLASKSVVVFSDWMSRHLDNATFKHAYIERKSGQKWACDSLYDAFQNYRWPHPPIRSLGVQGGFSFQSNLLALQALQVELTTGLQQPLSDARVSNAAIEVMKWGGVVNGNVNWLIQNSAGLAKRLQDSAQALSSGSTTHPLLASANLRFNAGMTKVYSLICNDFIIYDSRVAAALGWAVVKFCRAHNRSQVPHELAFAWAPAKEVVNTVHPKRRDPGEGAFTFPRLRAGTHHAVWNLKANWLLADVLQRAAVYHSGFCRIAHSFQPLRALEAALFMIGYDLPPLPGNLPRTQNRSSDIA